MVVNIINELSNLGFSEYEAKAYLALLKSGEPVTAYEIAKASGLPTSKIYEVIAKLEERQAALSIDEDGKKKYVAMDSDEFLNSYRQDFDASVARLRFELKAAKGSTNLNAAAIWNFRDTVSFRARTERMIRDCRERLLVSGWKEELLFFEKELSDAESRGVKIAIVHFGPLPITTGRLFLHPIEDTLYAERGGRGFVMVSDSREAVLATAYGDSALEGAWSMNRGFVILAEDYIKHDVYLMKIVKRMDAELIERFGEKYYKMRDVYTDEEEPV